MVRGLYIAGTGMLLQRRNMEIVTHNITNADTTGYKREILASHPFDDVLIRRVNDMGERRGPAVGPLNFGTQVDENYIDFSVGNYEDTGRSTDMAIVGDSFFVMQTPFGERYTRAGAFYINQNGYLIDGDGNFLLGENGPIYVGSDNFTVIENGDVMVAGVKSDTIRLVAFEDMLTLRKQGDNLYFSTSDPVQPESFAIKQGFLENSNVDAGREMVDMITVYRTYESNQRILTMVDEITGKAVNEIGRLR